MVAVFELLLRQGRLSEAGCRRVQRKITVWGGCARGYNCARGNRVGGGGRRIPYVGVGVGVVLILKWNWGITGGIAGGRGISAGGSGIGVSGIGIRAGGCGIRAGGCGISALDGSGITGGITGGSGISAGSRGCGISALDGSGITGGITGGSGISAGSSGIIKVDGLLKVGRSSNWGGIDRGVGIMGLDAGGAARGNGIGVGHTGIPPMGEGVTITGGTSAWTAGSGGISAGRAGETGIVVRDRDAVVGTVPDLGGGIMLAVRQHGFTAGCRGIAAQQSSGSGSATPCASRCRGGNVVR